MTFADDRERQHCALDLDRAREAKPQVYALAQWAIVWGERIRADLIGDRLSWLEERLDATENDLSEEEMHTRALQDAIDKAIAKIDADDIAAARKILEEVENETNH